MIFFFFFIDFIAQYLAEFDQLEVKRITLSLPQSAAHFHFPAGEADEHVGTFGNQIRDSCQTLLGEWPVASHELCDGELIRSSPGCQKSFVTAGI